MRSLLAAALALLLAPAAHAAYFDVAKLPPASVPGKEIADDVARFSTDFPHRVGGSPTEQQAAQFLLEEAKSLGYTAEILSLPVAAGDPGTIGRAVIATRGGVTRPKEHILFVGHYDVVPQTINGAYDNASGTSMIRAMAKAMKKVPTNRTVVFVWYSNEEQGLLASEAHAAQSAGIPIRAVLGFDMVGIGYPVAAPEPGRTCLCFWHGEEDEALEPLLRHVHFGVLGFPEEEGLVQFQGINSRNSDERSWDAQGYPVLRWAGMPTPDAYPAYHLPNDTMATIEQEAGGREFFEKGLRNTLEAAYTTALTLDNEMPVASAAATPSGAVVHFDASASRDPDGKVTKFAWDFGDGTTGDGKVTSHTYARPGSYVAKLTVADNLHSQVTSSTTVPVTIAKGAAPRTKSCKKPGKRASRAKKRAYKRCLKRKRRG